MSDIQVILNQLNDRLLKLEGEAFVMRSIIATTLAADDDVAEKLRRDLKLIEAAASEEMKRPLDTPTRKWIESAAAFVRNLLAGEVQAKPMFTVIDGGKSED